MTVPVIIDTDCGIDDAEAIILALSANACAKFRILGITCTDGNVGMEDVCLNVQRVLKVCGQQQIAVFEGERSGAPPDGRFHGADGFGDANHLFPVEQNKVQSGAVDWMVETARKHSGSILILALAPLTNLLAAKQVDPQFDTHLKGVMIMGGLQESPILDGMGQPAEFNFRCNPKAASEVCEKFVCPKLMVPYDTCFATPLPWDWLDEQFARKTAKAQMMSEMRVRQLARLELRKNQSGFHSCDLFAMAAFLFADDAISKKEDRALTVDQGGHCIYAQQGRPNIQVVIALKKDYLMKVIEDMLQ